MTYTTVYTVSSVQMYIKSKQSIFIYQNLESQIYLKYVVFCVFLRNEMGKQIHQNFSQLK